MVLKANHPGCGSQTTCACAPNECTLLYLPLAAGDVPAELHEQAGDWSINADGYLQTEDADALVRTVARHNSAGMRAEAKLRGSAAGDRLRVVVCWLDEATYLAAELELGCGSGMLRLYQDDVELASLPVPDAVVDQWHTLRVCYDPPAGGSGSGSGSDEDNDEHRLRAVLDTYRQVHLGNQVDVRRVLEAEVSQPSGWRAGWGTGEQLDGIAEFDELVWYDDAEDCPACVLPCDQFYDEFHRQPRDGGDVGCNWEVDGTVTISEHPSNELVSRATLAAGTTMAYAGQAASEVHAIRVQGTVAGAARFEICRDADGANALFARLDYDAGSQTVTLSIGEIVGGAETVLDSGSMQTAAFLLHVCYDGEYLLANLTAPEGTSPGSGPVQVFLRQGVSQTENLGAAVVAEDEDLVVETFTLLRRNSQGTPHATADCAWCHAPCEEYCIDGELPASVLVHLSTPYVETVVECAWSPVSFYGLCGQFEGTFEGTFGGPGRVTVVYRTNEVLVLITDFIALAWWSVEPNGPGGGATFDCLEEYSADVGDWAYDGNYPPDGVYRSGDPSATVTVGPA